MSADIFDEKHSAFITRHLKARTGERRRRLQEGHEHAEKLFLQNVWWPAVGHFDHLHPEYEVSDFKDGSRYLDFAYLREPFKICIENRRVRTAQPRPEPMAVFR